MEGGPLPIKALNVVLCGNSGVGKSSIVKRFVEDEFRVEHVSTVGMEHVIWNGLPSKGTPGFEIKLNIWDGGGKKHYRSSLRNLHSMADVLCFVFDLTNTETLDAITSVWLDCAHWSFAHSKWGNHQRRYPTVAYLIGTKADLDRKISREYGEQIAKAHGMHYFEMSAKTNQGIADMFEHIVTYAHDQNEIGRNPVYNMEIPPILMRDDDEVIEYRSSSRYCCWCCTCQNEPLFINEDSQ